MKNKDKNIKIIILITCATILGKLLGILRDCLLSYYFGTTSETDAFFLALSIPTVILGVFTASTDSAVIPQYKRVSFEHSKEDADKLFASIVNTLVIVAFVVSLIILIYPDVFVKIFAMGFSEDTAIIANKYLKIFSFVGLFHLLYCFLCTYNAAHKKNRIRTILAFSTNLIICLTLVFFHSDLQYVAYAYLLANGVCAFLPIYEMRKLNYVHYMRIDYKDKEFSNFWLLFVPIMGGALLADIQQYVDKNLSSNIIGGISYLNYGHKLITIFDSIFVVGIAVILLPMLSDLENSKDEKMYSKICSKVTRLLMEILMPFLSIITILANELITVLYGRGAFETTSIAIVTDVLRIYAPLILFMPLITIFSKFFHAKELNKIPFQINFWGVIINVVLSILFKRTYGLNGIALATSIAMLIELVIYYIIIRRIISWDCMEFGIKQIISLLIPYVICFMMDKIMEINFGNCLVVIMAKSCLILAIYFISYSVLLKKDIIYLIDKILSVIKR